MSRKNILIILGIVLVAGAVAGANFYFRKDKGLTVTTETIRSRDLEAVQGRLAATVSHTSAPTPSSAGKSLSIRSS